MSLEVNGIFDDLSKFDRGPWNGSFGDWFGVQSVCFVQSFAGNGSAGTDFSKMERTTEQNQAVVVLCNHTSDVYVFVLTLEKASHSNSNVFVGEGVRFHKLKTIISLFDILQINFDKKSDGIGENDEFGLYSII